MYPSAPNYVAAAWTNPGRPYCEFDIECDHHWFLIKFYPPGGAMFSYTINAEDGKPLNRNEIQWFIDTFTLVSFNGNNYDIPMMRLAMGGANVHRLKQLNDLIIPGDGKKGIMPWQVTNYFPEAIELPTLDHVDVQEPTPGVRIGLKEYMGRNHADTIQDLPFDPKVPMAHHLRPITDDYCGNDLRGTRGLRETIQKRIDLRIKIGEKYGVDVRSKSDAQMAEAVMKKRLGNPQKRYVPDGFSFKYTPPSHIQFATPELQGLLETIRNCEFVVRDVEEYDTDIFDTDGKKIKTGVKIPKELKGTVIKTLSAVKYKLGIGGLHSQEKCISHYAKPGEYTIVAEDVRSYYPELIRTSGQYPVQLGRVWLEMFANDILERFAAKDKVAELKKKLKAHFDALTETELSDWTALMEGLKIFLNGTFGKLFSKHSIFFAPEMGIYVTMTGQLSLLMLIEMLKRNGIETLSANTDGITCRVPAGLDWLHAQTVKYWEQITGLTMERKLYRSVHSISVNSYVAFAMDGEVTKKGMFADSGVLAGMQGAHPDRDISTDAAVAYLEKGTPIHQTVRQCRDIRKFVMLRRVKGGGQWREQWLGKVVRWYSCVNGSSIHYCSNGNKVPSSDGARPLMRLPDTFPTDIDYAAYESYASKLLQDCGVSI